MSSSRVHFALAHAVLLSAPMTSTSQAVAVLGVLSLFSITACQDRVVTSPGESVGTPSVSLPGYPNAIAQEASFIYVASDDGFLRRIDKATMTVTTLAHVDAPFVDGIAIDGTDIYFTVLLGGGTKGDVRRVAKTGGTPEILATGFLHPAGIVLDDTTVYVADMGTFAVGASGTDGVIRSLPKSGGSPVVLASGEQLPYAIALDETGVVWGNTSWGGINGAVRRIDKTGGVVTTLAANVDPETITALHASVFWQGELGIQTVPLNGGSVRTLTSRGRNGRGAFALDETGAYFDEDWQPNSPASVFYVPLSGGAPVPFVEPNAAVADEVTGGVVFALVDACKLFVLDYDATYAGSSQTTVHRFDKTNRTTTTPAAAACPY